MNVDFKINGYVIHTHPKEEFHLGLSPEHVIVDREVHEALCKFYENSDDSIRYHKIERERETYEDAFRLIDRLRRSANKAACPNITLLWGAVGAFKQLKRELKKLRDGIIVMPKGKAVTQKRKCKEFKIEDKVKIIKKVKKWAHGATWNKAMDDTIGKIGIVQWVGCDVFNDCRVKLPNGEAWYYPFRSLRKV